MLKTTVQPGTKSKGFADHAAASTKYHTQENAKSKVNGPLSSEKHEAKWGGKKKSYLITQ